MPGIGAGFHHCVVLLISIRSLWFLFFFVFVLCVRRLPLQDHRCLLDCGLHGPLARCDFELYKFVQGNRIGLSKPNDVVV